PGPPGSPAWRSAHAAPAPPHRRNPPGQTTAGTNPSADRKPIQPATGFDTGPGLLAARPLADPGPVPPVPARNRTAAAASGSRDPASAGSDVPTRHGCRPRGLLQTGRPQNH